MNTSRIDQLLNFLAANPTDSFVRFALALEYAKLGDDEKSLAYFKAILQDDPDYTGTYYHLGKLYERLNERESAINTYTAGLQKTAGKDEKNYRELQDAMNALLYDE